MVSNESFSYSYNIVIFMNIYFNGGQPVRPVTLHVIFIIERTKKLIVITNLFCFHQITLFLSFL